MVQELRDSVSPAHALARRHMGARAHGDRTYMTIDPMRGTCVARTRTASVTWATYGETAHARTAQGAGGGLSPGT